MRDIAPRYQRRIGPASKAGGVGPALKPDGTPDDNDRVEIGPTALAFAEWAAAGLPIPDLPEMRRWRLRRLTERLAARDLDGVLLADPLNIRYASDTTNMQVWNAHNQFRACFVAADGWMVVFDYKPMDLLTAYNPLVRETRGDAFLLYFCNGDRIEADATRFAGEILDLLREHGGGNRRLAVDRFNLHGAKALRQAGIEILDGEELMEKTRSIKSPDEIKAMRCAVHACERAMAEMRAIAAPGLTEVEIWSALHAGNIKRGGEWIETRLLTSGPRTNPWMQEAGPRVIQPNELLAFDSDMIGCYGFCADISRTWFLGEGGPSDDQKRIYREAHAHVAENLALLEPGLPFSELTRRLRPLKPEHVKNRYGVALHGIGLADEWPCIHYPQDFQHGRFEYTLEPGMCFCVETYVGDEDGVEGVKLEQQVAITDSGVELFSHYPFEAALLA